MNVSAWLRQTQSQLETADITTARLDCLVLLEDATARDRAWLLAHPEFELPTTLITILDASIFRRTQHVPLAYIRGKAEFYGREFTVNERTLVPRPETEAMIDLLRSILVGHCKLGLQPIPRDNVKDGKNNMGSRLCKHRENLTLVDIGTGSGAIAVTSKLEFPDAAVVATDIDKQCLKTTDKNAKKLGANIKLLHGSLLDPFKKPKSSMFGTSIFLCNLPYVPDNFPINTAAKHEPHHALFGGNDGLELYRELFRQLQTVEQKPRYILTESLPTQHETLGNISKVASYTLRKTDGFIQLFELL